MKDSRSGDDQQALRAALARIAPELAADWPICRDLDGMLAGVPDRDENVSEAWAWLGSYEVARGYAADLFEDAQLAAMPSLVEHAADALNALLGTTSFWARLSRRQRDALVAKNHALHQRLGRPIRSSTVACLVTARRAPCTRPFGRVRQTTRAAAGDGSRPSRLAPIRMPCASAGRASAEPPIVVSP